LTSKNDAAWNQVFAETKILNDIQKDGFHEVSAKTLAKIGKREPRLMAKLDSHDELPSVFKKHKLNILPMSRGDYVVFEDLDNKCFVRVPDFPEDQHPIKHVPEGVVNPFRLETLEKGLCRSESSVIELAFLSNLLGRFLKLENLVLTRRGRLSSGIFKIDLPSRNLQMIVKNAQIEVDSVFESEEAVVLIEAKMAFRDDFHVRQLYYPYIWLKTQTTKRVIPIFLSYSNGQFEFIEYEIGSVFGEVNPVQQGRFIIDEDAVATLPLSILLKYLPVPEELPETPFPQADDFEKVVDFVSAIGEGSVEEDQLSERYGFVKRQAGYYFNAAKYLGFVSSEREVTREGQRLLSQRFRVNRSEQLLKSMLARPVFRSAFDRLIALDFDITKLNVSEIEKWISETRTDKLAVDTRKRRAQTVKSWLAWVTRNLEFE
jgi:hypothetical protein